ncbi:MAG: hypothetical protein BGO12_22080 [Verrucomicrobia bacterium 61-8]|nr:hypothetical protein [Verrucomicrobiota bacterium]OJV23490.1 MAG: hypothetical protein BGO12_22080 [Verrucomicrobia bacterium 61-8]
MHKKSSQSASALLITLCMVVIISILLLSFLVVAQLDRQSTFYYGQSLRAEEIGLSALQEITGDLLQEIAAGSKADNDPPGAAYTSNGVRIYMPRTPKSSQAARIGFASASFGTDVSTNMLPPALVRASRATDSFYASPPAADYNVAELPPPRASTTSTTDAAANGRIVSVDRWNKPLLLGPAVPEPFRNNPPQWVYVTRQGSRVCTDEEALQGKLRADLMTTNAFGVLGRYAFVIYDEGALLDMNVAGSPTVTTNTANFRGKTYASYADLTQVPGLAQNVVDSFVSWRNSGGLSRAGSYTNAVQQAATNGFLRATSTSGASDNPLFSRQDMLDYFKKADPGNYKRYVPYLGTFSRAVNAPSWGPATPKASSIDYSAIAEQKDAPNRNLANMRGADGQPLIKRRFPLSRLALLTLQATSASGSDIHASFGLLRTSASESWTYDHGDPHNIMTLEEVRFAGREPDFFELLKAAILSGSLGRDPGAVGGGAEGGPAGINFDEYSSISDAQILRIGANIIDQYDSDGYPTAIYLDKHAASNAVERLYDTAFGTEDLPYLYRLMHILFTYKVTNAQTRAGQAGGWLQPQVWNPHQQPQTPGAERPTEFRISTHGKARIEWSETTIPNSKVVSADVDYDADPPAGQVTFSATASSFRDQPISLTVSNADAPREINKWSSSYNPDTLFPTGNRFVAINTGTLTFSPSAAGASIGRRITPVSPLTFVLEYRDASGTYRPYNLLSRLWLSDGMATSASVSPQATSNDGSTLPQVYTVRPDPRTDRFSSATSFLSYGVTFNTSAGRMQMGDRMQATLRPNKDYKFAITKHVPRASSGFTYTPTSGAFFIGSWAENLTGLADSSSYSDVDGVTRPADGFRRNASTGDGNLLYHTASASPIAGVGNASAGWRPVILNRPFRSVGELGYAFRDQPFKTLDFWSKDSADAALLDVFCIEEEPTVVAGQLNLNRAPVSVLKAIVSGASKNENTPSLILSGTDSSTVADSLASYVAGNEPLMNRADLVVAATGAANLSAVFNASLSSAADKANKAYGEASVRAFSSTANLRTWNLLIDVIAQSGRMAPGAKSLGGFLVEGERRFWLHIAIDRYTGKVVDQQLESVYE